LPVVFSQSEPFEDEVTVEPPQIKMNAVLATGLPRKKVTVNVRLSGKPHGDYAVRSVTTDPVEVMVQGERESLASISAVDTETVDITGFSADQTIVAPLRPLQGKDAQGKDVQRKDVSVTDVTSVNLLVQLEPILAQKQFSNVPVAVEGRTEGGTEKWNVIPSVVDVTLEAPPSRVANSELESLGLRAFVDVSNIFLRRTVLPVRAVVSADDFKIVRIEPSTVAVAEMGE
jgi:YbbR domain-containing protein